MMEDPPAGTSRLAVDPRARARREAAAAWVRAHETSAQLLVVAPSPEAGSRVLRLAAEGRPAAFGWQRLTLGELAARLAAAGLAGGGLAQAAPVVLTGMCARLVHGLRARGPEALGRYAVVADRPGLPRALARTFGELGLAGVGADDPLGGATDLARIHAGFRRALRDAGLADRSVVLRAAIARVRDPAPHPLLDHPTLLLDVPLRHALEGELVAALAARGRLTAIVPPADRLALARLGAALGASPVPLDAPPEPDRALSRLRAQLFAEVAEGAPSDEAVELFSAPGESRECVEIARRVRRAAAAGVPFDRMAVLLHAPERYRTPLLEACRRAEIPAYFARGTVSPDPAGRALLALLACRAEGLSARAFAEYLSLGMVPAHDPAGPPLEIPWLPPEDEARPLPEELLAVPAADDDDEEATEDAAVVAGTLRAPWRWERLLVEAAVIGGQARWRRRLDGLGRACAAELLALDDPEGPEGARLRQRRRDLAELARFALPLLDALAALPAEATWGEWASALSELAARAIRRPERVQAVLRELAPMGPIGPVGLTEVELVLGPRLSELTQPPGKTAAGKLYVASTEEARGLSFAWVFVPGLAERVFPRKVSEDPIALDLARAAISPALATNETRVGEERLALHLAIGAAEERLVLSYPRLDTARARPRVPSFYALEVMRAIEGALPSFEQLEARAERAGGGRAAWPAPEDPADAIDGAEHDLAVLAQHLEAEPDPAERGALRYLVDTNPHLARALRRRFLRWAKPFSRADGLVNPGEEARAVLAQHALDARPTSATALEDFAACPYRFYLRAVCGLEPRETPEPLSELGPLVRGQLIHEVQRTLLEQLRAEGLLPVTDARLERASALLDVALAEVGERFSEELAPPIERVWRDALAALRSDLSEWLLRASERPDWVPQRFELAFGLAPDPRRDPASVAEPVRLEEGILLRGAIDLVEEREGALRATDHKTGAAPTERGVTRGGRALQPVLYARALEALFPGRAVSGGRLYYCTAKGGFAEHTVPLDATAREAVRVLAEVVGSSIEQGFLPAAPDEDACAGCAYLSVCGPAEERRVARKHPAHLGPLKRLRKQP